MKLHFLVLLLLTTTWCIAQTPRSFYSTTNPKSVAILEDSELEKEPEIDHFVHLCPGYGGYELLHESGDARSWINIKLGKSKSDLMSETFTTVKGHFPFKANDVVEWRGMLKDDDFQPYAIIYRVTAQDPDEAAKNFTRLVVIHLDGANSKVLGCTHGKNEDAEAKALADTVRPK